MRRRSFTSSLCSRKNLGTRLEFRRCKSARLTQFLLIFLQFSPSFFSVLVFHHGLFHKFPNKTKTKQSISFVFICAFSSTKNEAQWTSYTAVGGKGLLLLFSTRTGKKSTAKQSDENSKLPEFQNEIARFFTIFAKKLANFSPFLASFLPKIVGANYTQLRHIIKALDIQHHTNEVTGHPRISPPCNRSKSKRTEVANSA